MIRLIQYCDFKYLIKTDEQQIAEVTEVWFFVFKRKRMCYRQYPFEVRFWRWVPSGEMCPNHTIEQLSEAYEVQLHSLHQLAKIAPSRRHPREDGFDG